MRQDTQAGFLSNGFLIDRSSKTDRGGDWLKSLSSVEKFGVQITITLHELR